MTWVQINNGFDSGEIFPITVYSLAVKDSLVFAGTQNGIFVSSNNGDSWSQTSFNALNGNIRCLLVIGSNLYAGADAGLSRSFPPDTAGGVFRSTDNGAIWTPMNAGFRSSNGQAGRVISMANIDTELFAGTWGQGIFYSSNSGQEWIHRWSNADVTSLVPVDSSIFAGTTYSSVFRSTDKGITWMHCDSGLTDSTTGYDLSVLALATSGRSLFAGTYFYGVFLSTDLGRSWSQENRGLTGAFGADIDVRSLAVFGEYLYAGTSVGGIWRRPLSDMIASVLPERVPQSFLLRQNYPNPFNPSTTVSYELNQKCHVRLRVFDLLGREVTTLVNERQSAGVYHVRFDGSGTPSGVLFYQLIGNGKAVTRTMMLLH